MFEKRGKQIISVLLVAFTCLLLVFSVFKIIYTTKTNEESPMASEGFTFVRDGSYFGDDEDKALGVTVENHYVYNHTYEFFIDSPEGLMSFSRSVAEGYDFKGKKVKLLNDIDWNDMNYDIYDDKDTARTFVPIGANAWGGTYYGCKPFRGVFDGGSNTISNLRTKFYYGQAGAVGLGLFACVMGSKNETDFYVADISFVNIENYTIELDTMGGVIYIGGVVGIGYDVVQTRCCLVENLSLINWWHNPNLYFAGIIGACTGIGKIDDCYVDDINVEVHNNGNYPDFTSYFGPSVDIGLADIELTECIAADKDESDLEGYALHYQNNNPHIDPTLKIQTNEIFKKTDDIITKNEVRDLFSDDWANELDWHMCPDSIANSENVFNDGWPYPKWFIDFEEYIFYNNSSFATMTFDDFIETYKVINIPREVTIDINEGSTFAMVYGLRAKIEVKDGYYAGFKKDGDKVYKVDGGGEIYKLKFSALLNPDGSNSSYSPKCEYIEIYYGQDIKIEMKMENGFTCLYFGDTLVYDNLPKIYAIKNSIEVFNSSIKKQTLNLGYNNIEDLGNHKDNINCNIYYKLKSYGLETK